MQKASLKFEKKILHRNYSQLFKESVGLTVIKVWKSSVLQLLFKRFWLKQMKKLRLNGFTEGRNYLI